MEEKKKRIIKTPKWRYFFYNQILENEKEAC